MKDKLTSHTMLKGIGIFALSGVLSGCTTDKPVIEVDGSGFVFDIHADEEVEVLFQTVYDEYAVRLTNERTRLENEYKTEIKAFGDDDIQAEELFNEKAMELEAVTNEGLDYMIAMHEGRNDVSEAQFEGWTEELEEAYILESLNLMFGDEGADVQLEKETQR